jgi:DNA-binding MarR family transcriptional regulator
MTSEAKAQPASKSKPVDVVSDLTESQAAVLKALRSKMDKNNRVEARAAELAKAASIPPGSLHYVLASLEKKRMIRTERQGTARFAAIYEVLEMARNSPRTVNGVAPGKEAHADRTAR